MSTIISTWEGHEETRQELLQVAYTAASAIKAVSDKGYCVVNAITHGMTNKTGNDPIIDQAVKSIQDLLDLSVSLNDNQLILNEWKNVVISEMLL